VEKDMDTGLSSLMAEYSDISEPNSPTDISEPEMVDPSPVVATTPTGASDEKSSGETSSPMDESSSLMETDLDTGLSSLMTAYSDISEPNSPTDISEPEMVDPTPMVATTPTGASEATVKSLRHKVLSTPKAMVTGPSDATLQSLREKVASNRTHMDDHLPETVPSTSEEIRESVILSQEEEELPEFNSVEDLRQWLGLCSPMDATVQTTSEEIPEMVIVSPEEELPEFNSVEDLRQWLGL
jgi:hypothetical protein